MSIVLAVPLALILTTVVAIGHQANSISGVVDCDGNYSIGVMADVWDNVHLIVTLNGSVISDEAIPGDDDSNRLFGYFTGTGAAAGDVISAYTSDNAQAATGELTVVEEPPCSTPTPSPTETPSATPVATPLVTPSETPTATIPNTAMHLAPPDFGSPIILFIGFLFVGLGVLVIVGALSRRFR
jgi:hypothetical protein